MKKNIPTAKSDIERFSAFLKQNKGKNIANSNLKEQAVIDAFSWDDPSKDKKDLIGYLQAYQRVSKLLPGLDDTLVVSLIGDGLTAALIVCSIPKDKFLATYGPKFEGHRLSASTFYDNAATVKANVLLEYMRIKQMGEPHVRQTNLNSKL